MREPVGRAGAGDPELTELGGAGLTAEGGTPEARRAGLERLMQLRTFPPLADVPPEHLAALAELTEERSFAAGTTIYRPGQPVDEVLYLIDGMVELRGGGRARRRQGARTIVGWLTALSRTFDGPEVVALESTTALALHREDQIELFDDNVELLLFAVRSAARDLLEARRALAGDAGFRPPEAPATDPLAPGLVGKLSALRRTALFARVPVEVLAELVRDSPEVRYSAGDRLWVPGQPAGVGLVLVAGVLAGSSVGRSGLQRFTLEGGDLAGMPESLAGEARWYEAAAATDLSAIQIHPPALFDLFEDHVGAALAVLEVLASEVLALRRLEGAQGGADPGSPPDPPAP